MPEPGKPPYTLALRALQASLTIRQKIKSRAYVSFSFLGLLLVLIFGILIVFLSLTIEPISRFFHRRAKKDNYKLLEWNSNSSLQLQRLAFDGLGIGEWSGCDKTVPYTTRVLTIEPLDVSDPKHPRVAVPAKSNRRDSSLEVSYNTTLQGDSGSDNATASHSLDCPSPLTPTPCDEDEPAADGRMGRAL
jgi:hypothetical protein